jgi:hypothetical protein
MPAKGYRNFTIRSEAAEKLETYASINGLKVVQLINKIAQELEIDVPFMYLLRAIKDARLLMLKESVQAEYLRDLLVRLYLKLQSASMGLQTILSSDTPHLLRVKSPVASIVSMLNYQLARLEKILNETYPRGWAVPTPPPPTAYGFLPPSQKLPPEAQDKLINMQLDNLLKAISNQIDNSIQILEKIKPYLPQLWESVGEALTNILSSIEKIRVEEIKLSA